MNVAYFKKFEKFIILFLSILFVILFDGQSAGYNVFIFTILYVIADILIQTNSHPMSWLFRIGCLMSGLFFILNHSNSNLILLFLSWGLLMSSNALEKIDNLVQSLIYWPYIWLGKLQELGMYYKNKSKVKWLDKLKQQFGFMIWPMALLILFLLLFVGGSEFVQRTTFNVLDDFLDGIAFWLNKFDFSWFGLFIIGLLLSVGILTINKIQPSILSDTLKENTQRVPVDKRSSLAFLIMINILLAWVIFLEVKHVWFGFSWKGELLKGFVHQGTYALVFSVFLSVVVLVYLYKHHLKEDAEVQSKTLKLLSISWLLLNGAMVLSVFIRNYWYVHYFGLAYKRIGLWFFLILCVVALSSMLYVLLRKSKTIVVLKVSSIGAYVLLLTMSSVNWDRYIAHFNLSHYQQAYIYVPFLFNLNDSSIPILTLSDEQINQIDEIQAATFPLLRKHQFIEEDYASRIEIKKSKFEKRFKSLHWLSKTYADQKAYEEIHSR